MKTLHAFDFLRRLVALTILVPIYWSQTSLAATNQDLNPLYSDLQTHVYYWAYNGRVNTDPDALKDLIDTTAALTEVLGLGDYEITRTIVEKDVLAQGGPQVLLSVKAANLLKMGVQESQYAPVNRFLNSLSKFNPQLGEVASIFTDHMRNETVELRKDLQVTLVSRARCLQSCAADFLGLQNNQTFQYMTGRQNNLPSDSRQLQSEKAQISRFFPNDREMSISPFSNTTKERTAFISDQKNHCIGVCMKEISSEAIKWGGALGGLARIAGGTGLVAGATAGAVVGSAVGLGICMNGPECSRTAEREHQVKVKEIELQERKQRLQENEIRAKEEQQNQERERKAAEESSKNAKAEAAKQQSEESAKKKRSEEESKRTREHVEKGDWHDSSKNKDSKNDSSTSCEATKTCDGTMNATVIPEHMREDKDSSPLKDAHGNILEILDLTSTPMPKDFSKKEKGVEPKKIIFDNKPLDWAPKEANILRDGTGKVITTFEMTSTPIPGRN